MALEVMVAPENGVHALGAAGGHDGLGELLDGLAPDALGLGVVAHGDLGDLAVLDGHGHGHVAADALAGGGVLAVFKSALGLGIGLSVGLSLVVSDLLSILGDFLAHGLVLLLGLLGLSLGLIAGLEALVGLLDLLVGRSVGGGVARGGLGQALVHGREDGLGGDGGAGHGVHALGAAGGHDGLGELLDGLGADALGLGVVAHGHVGDLAVLDGHLDGHVAADTLAGSAIGAVGISSRGLDLLSVVGRSSGALAGLGQALVHGREDGLGGDGGAGHGVHALGAVGLHDLGRQLLDGLASDALGLGVVAHGDLGDLAVLDGHGHGHVAADALAGGGVLAVSVTGLGSSLVGVVGLGVGTGLVALLGVDLLGLRSGLVLGLALGLLGSAIGLVGGLLLVGSDLFVNRGLGLVGSVGHIGVGVLGLFLRKVGGSLFFFGLVGGRLSLLDGILLRRRVGLVDGLAATHCGGHESRHARCRKAYKRTVLH